MPQIKVYLSRPAANMILDSLFDDLRERLTSAVETAFEIEGKNDVAFSIIDVRYTHNEAPVQIEVLYTAGGEEYEKGINFDPGDGAKNKAVELLLAGFSEFIRSRELAPTVPSIWIRPQYKSLFKPGETGD